MDVPRPIIKQLCVGPFQVHAYVVGCPQTKEGLIIDPGGEEDLILSVVSGEGLKIRYILNTHGHADHVMANSALKRSLSAPTCMHELDDAFFARSSAGRLASLQLGFEPPEPQKPSVPPVAAPVPFQQEPVEAAGEPVPSVTLPQEQPSPVVAEMPAVAAPLPPLAPPAPKEEAPAVAEGAVLTPKEEAFAAAPLTATAPAEPRQLVALPPVTIEGDLSLQPPRVRLTVVPPSQRLYRRTGVALVTVPPEKRPLIVPEEKALAPDLSIPLAAERYRSHTATIPFLRFGVSW